MQWILTPYSDGTMQTNISPQNDPSLVGGMERNDYTLKILSSTGMISTFDSIIHSEYGRGSRQNYGRILMEWRVMTIL